MCVYMLYIPQHVKPTVVHLFSSECIHIFTLQSVVAPVYSNSLRCPRVTSAKQKPLAVLVAPHSIHGKRSRQTETRKRERPRIQCVDCGVCDVFILLAPGANAFHAARWNVYANCQAIQELR